MPSALFGSTTPPIVTGPSGACSISIAIKSNGEPITPLLVPIDHESRTSPVLIPEAPASAERVILSTTTPASARASQASASTIRLHVKIHRKINIVVLCGPLRSDSAPILDKCTHHWQTAECFATRLCKLRICEILCGMTLRARSSTRTLSERVLLSLPTSFWGRIIPVINSDESFCHLLQCSR
jgi:hypothetical protein